MYLLAFYCKVESTYSFIHSYIFISMDSQIPILLYGLLSIPISLFILMLELSQMWPMRVPSGTSFWHVHPSLSSYLPVAEQVPFGIRDYCSPTLEDQRVWELSLPTSSLTKQQRKERRWHPLGNQTPRHCHKCLNVKYSMKKLLNLTLIMKFIGNTFSGIFF